MTPITVTIPLRLGTGQNMREHHYTKAKRVKSERHAIAWSLAALRVQCPPSTMPLLVHLVRVSPGTVKLDDDNLSGAWKAGRDQIAQWLGRDDGHDSVTWTYGQRKGPWGVEITISERAA